MNCTQTPEVSTSLTKQVNHPCLISVGAEKYNPTMDQKEKRTGLFENDFHGSQTLLGLTVHVDLFVSQTDLGWPSCLSVLLVPSMFIHPRLQGERISLAEETHHYFLPEEGTDHHSWEIRVILLNKIPREFPNILLSQKFLFI